MQRIQCIEYMHKIFCIMIQNQISYPWFPKVFMSGLSFCNLAFIFLLFSCSSGIKALFMWSVLADAQSDKIFHHILPYFKRMESSHPNHKLGTCSRTDIPSKICRWFPQNLCSLSSLNPLTYITVASGILHHKNSRGCPENCLT